MVHPVPFIDVTLVIHCVIILIITISVTNTDIRSLISSRYLLDNIVDFGYVLYADLFVDVHGLLHPSILCIMECLEYFAELTPCMFL